MLLLYFVQEHGDDEVIVDRLRLSRLGIIQFFQAGSPSIAQPSMERVASPVNPGKRIVPEGNPFSRILVPGGYAVVVEGQGRMFDHDGNLSLE